MFLRAFLASLSHKIIAVTAVSWIIFACQCPKEAEEDFWRVDGKLLVIGLFTLFQLFVYGVIAAMVPRIEAERSVYNHNVLLNDRTDIDSIAY